MSITDDTISARIETERARLGSVRGLIRTTAHSLEYSLERRRPGEDEAAALRVADGLLGCLDEGFELIARDVVPTPSTLADWLGSIGKEAAQFAQDAGARGDPYEAEKWTRTAELLHEAERSANAIADGGI